jgi:PAS domain-containing protein
MFSQVAPKFQLPQFGLFTWNVPENRLVADEIYASIYGLSAEKLAKGIGIEEIIGLIYEDDRERAARSTHASILAGKLGTIDYRISVGGLLRNVSAYGRCFRDEDDIPSYFTGGVALDLSFSFAESRQKQNH